MSKRTDALPDRLEAGASLLASHAIDVQRILGPPSSPLEYVSRASALPSGAMENNSMSPEVLGRTPT